jgi:hypothetical protein
LADGYFVGKTSRRRPHVHPICFDNRKTTRQKRDQARIGKGNKKG